MTVNREMRVFLWKQGFGEEVVQWVTTLYSSAMVRVQVNGRLGLPLRMERGLRQGCPLSQILFACMQDPFYRLIDGGVQEKGEEGVSGAGIMGYVDDTTILVNGEVGLPNVGRVIEMFGAATGMRVNGAKSRLLEVGSWVGGGA